MVSEREGETALLRVEGVFGGKTEAECADHGAAFMGANLLYLKGGTKDHFMGFLRHAFPDMVESYRRLYPGAYAAPDYVATVRALIEMLQERHDVNRRARRTPRTNTSADSDTGPADPEQKDFDW